ncbi:MAG: guanylate kinase [Polyangiales bacterium]
MADDVLLLILSSPSGAGKTTLTRRLLNDKTITFRFSVSHTTRRPRANEVNGQDYHFTDEASFRAMAAQGMFAEWAYVHGNYYGTSVAEIERAKGDGAGVLLFDIDYQGARQIRAKFPDAVGVFILPPSMEELRARLEGRGSEDAETIKRRFEKAQTEIEHYPFFDYIVVNKDINVAEAELRGIIYAERCRRARRAADAEALLPKP